MDGGGDGSSGSGAYPAEVNIYNELTPNTGGGGGNYSSAGYGGSVGLVVTYNYAPNYNTSESMAHVYHRPPPRSNASQSSSTSSNASSGSTSSVSDTLYNIAKGVELNIGPIASATAYGGMATRNPESMGSDSIDLMVLVL